MVIAVRKKPYLTPMTNLELLNDPIVLGLSFLYYKFADRLKEWL